MRKGHRDNPIDVREESTKLFSLISIETGSECNRRCAFCPVSHNPRPDEFMEWELFEKIIEDLVVMGYNKRLMLYSYNEPLRDARLPSMIEYVRSALPRVGIMLNTNGDYFKGPEDISHLFFKGLSQMQINIYSAADGCGDQVKIDRGIEKAKKRYDVVKGWLDEMAWIDQEGSVYQYKGPKPSICQVVPKWNFQPINDHENDMPTLVHGISVRHHIANRAGNIPKFKPDLVEPLEKMCIRPFRAMNINWRGDTMLCCNDYEASASVGNVGDDLLSDLWNDERWHNYRIKLQMKKRDIHLCDVCDYNGGFYQHNVPHVTRGDKEDAKIIFNSLRSKEDAGF